jgi:hypothetical protein
MFIEYQQQKLWKASHMHLQNIYSVQKEVRLYKSSFHLFIIEMWVRLKYIRYVLTLQFRYIDTEVSKAGAKAV